LILGRDHLNETNVMHFSFNILRIKGLFMYGPGVDSASNRNEYQEYFLGVKAAGA
jgi:hypothetical protein